jgi:hypothetical protein
MSCMNFTESNNVQKWIWPNLTPRSTLKYYIEIYFIFSKYYCIFSEFLKFLHFSGNGKNGKTKIGCTVPGRPQPTASGLTAWQPGSRCWPQGRVGLCMQPSHGPSGPATRHARGARTALGHHGVAMRVVAWWHGRRRRRRGPNAARSSGRASQWGGATTG